MIRNISGFLLRFLLAFFFRPTLNAYDTEQGKYSTHAPTRPRHPTPLSRRSAALADTAVGATEAAGNALATNTGAPPNPHWGFKQYWSKKKDRWVVPLCLSP